MTANAASIVPHVPHEGHNLLTDVTGPDTRSETASTVELPRFRRRLALGAALVPWFFGTRAAVRPAAPVLAPEGTPLRSPAQRLTTDDAVVGHGCCGRPYFTARGPQGSCPLDTARRVPARGDADRLREWAA
jgi:hypothetical protein